MERNEPQEMECRSILANKDSAVTRKQLTKRWAELINRTEKETTIKNGAE